MKKINKILENQIELPFTKTYGELKKIKKQIKKIQNGDQLKNDVPSIFDGIYSTSYSSQPISKSDSLVVSNSYSPITLNRVLLSYSYMTHGVLQTAIDQPVEDAFRGGLIIKSNELDSEDIEDLQRYIEENKILQVIKSTFIWARLYGGAGIIINTDQDYTKPLNENLINENSPLEFIDADRWELLLQYMNEGVECPYNYYGVPIHKTRVIKIIGKEAPSFIRKRLQGWGMSEVERMIRSINSYTKNQSVIFELLDEAKIDVFKMEGYNASMVNKDFQAITERVQLANYQKNYQSALSMDKEDDYEQKQLSFGGLAEMLQENRIGVASDLKIPLTKLFGMSSAGFNSGEDDIENYNSLVETSVRSKSKHVIIPILQLCCRKLFGFVPDFTIDFHPLRILNSEQEENVKTQRMNRVLANYDRGLFTAQEAMEAQKVDEIFNLKTEVGNGDKEPIPPQSIQSPEDFKSINENKIDKYINKI